MSSTNIQDIPIEVFFDHLLPIVELHDLLSLAKTNKFFAVLCADDTFWKLKLREDLNYSITDARDKGFKLLYRGIRRPHVYVWGQSDRGRLGLKDPDQYYKVSGVLQRGIPFPVELEFKNTRIVSIVAGGWSFQAIDDLGKLHIWGTLDAETWDLRAGSFADSSHTANTPVNLELPEPISSISAGRKHLIALDAKSQVWLFTSWGRPARIVSPLIDDPTSAISTVTQVEAGWGQIAVLTKTGNVYVDWPFDGQMEEKIEAHTTSVDHVVGGEHQPGPHDPEVDENGVVHCATWDLHHDMFELPAIPAGLPTLTGTKTLSKDDYDDLRLVKIAAGDDFVVGLTNGGHVLKIDISKNGNELDFLRQEFRHGRRDWEYLPQYSDINAVKQHPVFTEGKSGNPPESMRITHISASFQTFVAYSVGSTSVVLMGNHSTDASTAPNILPGLQNRNIVSVVLGDYHFGALTEDGMLLSWGQYSYGALGLGDPLKLPRGAPGGYPASPSNPDAGGDNNVDIPPLGHVPLHQSRHIDAGPPPEVHEPSEVHFGHQDGKRDKFVFGIAACGWHSAALVIDLKPDEPGTRSTLDAENKETERRERLEAQREWDALSGEGDREGQMPGAFPLPRVTRGPVRGGGERGLEPGRGIPLPVGLRGVRIGYAGRGRVLPPGGLPGTGTGRVLHGGFRGPPFRGRGQNSGYHSS